MTTKTLDTITREEFDRRLDAYNERRHNELQRIEAQQAQVGSVLAHYEQMLDEIEAGLATSYMNDWIKL